MNNLYSDKEFQEGIKRGIGSIEIFQSYLKTEQPHTPPLHIKGIDFCRVLLQSIHDALAEEPIEPLSGYEPEGIVY